MRFSRINAFAKVETLYVVRDKRSLGLAFVLPFVLLVLFGSSLSYDVKNIPIVIWDQDRSSKGRELLSAFEGSRYFRVIGFWQGYDRIVADLDRAKASVAMIIPPGYSKALARGKKAEVQFLMDGTDSTTAGISSGYISGIILEENLHTLLRMPGLGMPPINPCLRVWFNPEMESKNFIIPGLIGVILVIIGALLSSLTLSREWETGTMETMIALPLRPMEVVIGKMIPYFVIGMINITILLISSVFIFHVPIRGSIALIYLFSTVFTIGTLGLGILISGVAKNQTLANQMAIVLTYLPSFILSGFVFPIDNMPFIVQGITYLVPARYFIYALKAIFLKGLGLDSLYTNLLLLSIFAVGVTILAARKVPRRLD